MSKLIRVLIVENESLVSYAIEKALKHISDLDIDMGFKITMMKDYESTLHELTSNSLNSVFDLVLLNINIEQKKLKPSLFADDLAIKLKEINHETSIIALTSSSDSYLIYNVMQSFNPEGVLLKSDVDFKELVKAICTILDDVPHYSKTVLRLMRSHICNTHAIDKTDRSILYYLSKGLKTKELTELVFLSIGGVERRKRNLKEIFNVEKGGDKMLLKCAKERGYI